MACDDGRWLGEVVGVAGATDAAGTLAESPFAHPAMSVTNTVNVNTRAGVLMGMIVATR